MTNDRQWSPHEIAYLYFYLNRGITHENISKLLALKAPREPGRTYDAVRAKLKQLRKHYHLDNEGGKADTAKVLEYLSLALHILIRVYKVHAHLEEHMNINNFSVDERKDLDPEREITMEEYKVMAMGLH